jgi:hypothetical protein
MDDLEKTEKSHFAETRKLDRIKDRKDISPVLAALYGFFGGFFAFLLFAIVGTILFVYVFCSYGISSDLTEYHQIIKAVEFDPTQKQFVLEQIERVREKARSGKHPGFWVWLDYDESIRNLIDDRNITEQEVEELIRELESLDKSNNNK